MFGDLKKGFIFAVPIEREVLLRNGLVVQFG
jgi:hypothetical protein